MEIERKFCVENPGHEDLEEGMIPCPADDKITFWDIYERPDPFEAYPGLWLMIARVVCCPIWIVNRLFPFRYFTSTYQLSVILYLSLYITDTWRNDWAQGVLWLMCLYVPPASSIIFCLAHGVTNAAVQQLGATMFIDYHLLSHGLPSLLVFVITDIPHPPVLVSTGIFIFLATLYLLYLRYIYCMSPLDNYFIANASNRPIALGAWCLCMTFACVGGELLFACTRQKWMNE